MTSLFPSIRFGGDYNPEQWPREVWAEDVQLMQRAGVTTATVGVFSWAKLEQRRGEFTFEWLDDVLDGLHAGGIRVIMATATASPPAWLAKEFPDSLPVDEFGVRLGFGSRQQYSPSSSAFRKYALRLVEKLAERYASHPAIEVWHIGNEYGCHVSHSYDAESEQAFRGWLERRYGTIDRLNDAWGTAFWSQQYADFEEVSVPAAAPTFRNPTQLLDFDRFSSDALLALHDAELEVLRRVSPDIPVTTNFMGFFRNADYWQWAASVDIVSDDAYPDPADPENYVRLAASRDLMRSLGGGKPWMLMEQAPSAVNWRTQNAPKAPGQNRVHSLQAVARGADAVLYFQWRQAKAGAEKFHSALLPHAGADTRIFREVEALGAELATLDTVLGESVPARVAMVFDWDSWRAIEQPAVPTLIDYVETVLAWYRPFLRRGVAVDFVRAGSDLGAYDIVVAPVLQVAAPSDLEGLAAVVDRGATLVVSYQTGILNRDLHAYLGGYLGGPGALQQALGVRVEEFAPLAGVSPLTAPTTTLTGTISGGASIWQESVRVDDAEVIASFGSGWGSGQPAVTRRSAGTGAGWYVATQPDEAALDLLIDRLIADTGVEALLDSAVFGVEAVRRGSTLFLFNHTSAMVTVSVGGVVREIEPFGAVLIHDAP